MSKNIACVFPGQGSQSKGMLAELAASYSEVEATFAEASAALGYDLWDVVQNDPNEVIIDFAESKIADMSAIDAVNKITSRYASLNKKVHLKHLSSDCVDLLKNAEAIIDVNIMEDPTYKVVAKF